MRESGQEKWWRKSVRLAGVALGAAAFICITPWLLAAALAGRTVIGLPFPYFLLVLVVPVAILAAIFWFARRQQSLDHRYDVTGNQA